MIRMISRHRDENGNIINMEILIPHEELDHPEREEDICAVCPNVLYPECKKICAMLKD